MASDTDCAMRLCNQCDIISTMLELLQNCTESGQDDMQLIFIIVKILVNLSLDPRVEWDVGEVSHLRSLVEPLQKEDEGEGKLPELVKHLLDSLVLPDETATAS